MTDKEKQKHKKKYKDLPEEQKKKKKRLSKTIYRKYDGQTKQKIKDY